MQRLCLGVILNLLPKHRENWLVISGPSFLTLGRVNEKRSQSTFPLVGMNTHQGWHSLSCMLQGCPLLSATDHANKGRFSPWCRGQEQCGQLLGFVLHSTLLGNKERMHRFWMFSVPWCLKFSSYGDKESKLSLAQKGKTFLILPNLATVPKLRDCSSFPYMVDFIIMGVCKSQTGIMWRALKWQGRRLKMPGVASISIQQIWRDGSRNKLILSTFLKITKNKY